MSKSDKIFNVDFNKSGTTSLSKAMEILGFKALHYTYNGKKIADIIQNNKENNKKLLDGLDDYEFFSDFGGTKFYKELDKQYPCSKFILTIRELNSWLISKERHAKKNPNYKSGLLKIDKNKWKMDREQKISELKEYFKDRPEDFLIIDIHGGDKWEKLCDFLSKPIPNKPFPFLNKYESIFISIFSSFKDKSVRSLRRIINYFKHAANPYS